MTRNFRSRPLRRWVVDISMIAAGIVVGVIVMVTLLRDSDPPPLARSVDPMLPDLIMSPINLVAPGIRTEDGRQPLDFDATVSNVGEGDFLASASRSWPWTDDWKVVQRIQERNGGYSEHQTDVGLVLGGDGHGHWHIRAVEAHRLEDLATGEVVAEGEKLGFCFYDTHAIAPDLPGAPIEPRYFRTACEGQVSTGQVVGLSVGWGDIYPLGLPEQRFYIESLPAGDYRLRQIADPDRNFLEVDEGNNETWVDIRLAWADNGTPIVTMIGTAPIQ